MSKTFQTISPIDNSIFLEREYANDKLINQVLTNATKAQVSWSETSIEDRAAVCRKVVTYFIDHAEEIGKELTWQMGRPIKYTPFEITKGFKERAEYMIAIAANQLQDIQAPNIDGFTRYIKREPVGTVLVLAPWNYPYLTSVNVIIPAIMAGNSVILKHATQTALCAERYSAAFESAGFPKGVFQHLHITHEQVGQTITNNGINYVAFTGSVAGGEAIQKAICGRFIHAGLELGGKDPAYVRADADLLNAIENLVDGAFFNSGQSCCGVERIYVHESHYADFVEEFVALTKQYQLGNPMDMSTNLGPMVRAGAAEFVRKQVASAVKSGAKALVNPSHFEANKIGSPYMSPQVLVDVNHQMDIMKEESFGPVVGIMSVKSDEVAIQYMNDSAYGLTASVWTQDMEAAQQIGHQIDTGTFYMNRCDYLDPALAWTGVKNSGRGCTLSPLGYEALTRPKSYHLKH